MRIRTGLRPEDWLDHGPSTPLPPKGYSGGLVVGASGPVEADRRLKTQRRAEKAAYVREWRTKKEQAA